MLRLELNYAGDFVHPVTPLIILTCTHPFPCVDCSRRSDPALRSWTGSYNSLQASDLKSRSFELDSFIKAELISLLKHSSDHATSLPRMCSAPPLV